MTRDCSAVVVLAVKSNGKSERIRLVHTKLWRPVLGRKISLTDVESHILQLDRQFNLEFVCFDPWQAEHLAQRIEADTDRRSRNNVRSWSHEPFMREVPPTGANLREIASLVIESFQDRRFQFFNDENLKRDLLKLRVEEKSYGYRLEYPRDGHGHGDTFSAFSLAFLAIHDLAGRKPLVVQDLFKGITPETSFE